MTLDARDFPSFDSSQDDRSCGLRTAAPDDEPTVLRVGRGAPAPADAADDETTVLRIATPVRRRVRHS